MVGNQRMITKGFKLTFKNFISKKKKMKNKNKYNLNYYLTKKLQIYSYRKYLG